jgi:hypothetical protein
VTQDPFSKAPQDATGQAPHPGYPDQPGYPPPGYGYGPPQPYGPPGWGGPPAYPAAAPPTNTLAIIALVMAFVFSPAAIVLGVIARKQIRETGESGDGLALAGLILGIAFTVIAVLLVVLWIVAFAAVLGFAGTVPS